MPNNRPDLISLQIIKTALKSVHLFGYYNAINSHIDKGKLITPLILKPLFYASGVKNKNISRLYDSATEDYGVLGDAKNKWNT